MPTYDELTELKTNCTWIWTTQNDVDGYKVLGPNGSSIFLPKAEYHHDNSLSNGLGEYMSSSLYPLNPDYMYFLRFNFVQQVGNRGHRSSGLSVRAVCT